MCPVLETLDTGVHDTDFVEVCPSLRRGVISGDDSSGPGFHENLAKGSA